MKNYIVRICRHQKDNPGMLVGIVEDIEIEEKKTFATLDELWEILNCGKEGKGCARRRTKNSRERSQIKKEGMQNETV